MTTIAIIHNLTSGGAVRVMQQTNKVLSQKYNIIIYKPKPFENYKKEGLRKILSYLKYLYIDLPKNYREISDEVNRTKIQTVIVHHDSYIKTPLIFNKLNKNKKITIKIINDPKNALNYSKKIVGNYDLIVATGSIYMIGELI